MQSGLIKGHNISHIVLSLVVFTLVLSGISGPAANAQYLPGFDVNSTKGCAPFTVIITDLSTAPDSLIRNYDWGDGSALDTVEMHLYENPGTYRIVQTVQNSVPPTYEVVIEVVDTPNPVFATANCSGPQGSVNIPDDYYEGYYVEWGDGTSNILPQNPNAWFWHAFGVTGTYNIKVQGLINGAQTELDSANYRCGSNTKQLVVTPGIADGEIDEIAVKNIDPVGEIRLDYTLDPYTTYILEGRPFDGPPGSYDIYDTLNNLNNTDSVIVGNLNTESNYYCFRITAIDACTGNRFPSGEACSIRAFGVSELNLNRIVWDTESMDFTDYEILKDGQSFVTIDTLTTREYADTDVNCGRVYCYSIIMHENNGLISRSATVCVTAISAGIDEPIIDISASVDGSDVQLSWPPSVTFPANAYIPQRLNENGSFLPLDTLSETRFTDPDLAVTGNRYFYKVYVTDECGNVSDTSAVAGTILLQVGADGLLTWSTYKGWSNGVNSYVLNKLDQTGQLIISIPMGQDTSFVDNPDDSNLQGVIYRVQAVPADSQLDPVFSNFIQIIYRSEVHFPNAFTPNGDGLNDTFTFKGRFIQSGTIKIFSRWGELVYTTSELDQGWDGTINGQEAPVGTYVYSAQLTDDSGIQFEKRGQIILIR